MSKWKKISSIALATGMVFSMTACDSNSGSKDPSSSPSPTTETASPTTEPAGGEVNYAASFNEIKLGDNADLTANLKFLTNRTDLVDTVYKDYIAKFNEIYPNITIQYEGSTDYEQDAKVRLTTKDWGQICMISSAIIDKDELGNYFESFGKLSDLDPIYNFADDKEYNGEVYGIPSLGNARGIVYNKKVFEQAGITEMPKTPDEFLAALQQIKDKTDAIPMYSNFSAGWTLGAWDDYINGTATGSADFKNITMPHMKDPFAKKDDMTGPYAVYYVLYEATARGLIEDDPTTSDWESSKPMINNGEIGTMVLGSWAVTQMQAAGENAADIGYMPFPITVNGKQYASAGADYCYAINVNATDEEKLAAKLYIKWLTEESNFAFDQGGIPIVKGAEYPATLEAFDGIELVTNTPALPGEETLFVDVNTESEVGLEADSNKKAEILEAALTKSKTLDEIMADWNAKWSTAQEKLKVEVNQ